MTEKFERIDCGDDPRLLTADHLKHVLEVAASCGAPVLKLTNHIAAQESIIGNYRAVVESLSDENAELRREVERLKEAHCEVRK